MNDSAVHTEPIRSLASHGLQAIIALLRTSRIIPVLVVSSFAGIMAQAGYIGTYAAVTAKLGEPPDWMDAMMWIQWIASFASPFIVWVVCAAVAHLMAVIFDGRGAFKDLFFVWGYGYIPLAAAAWYFYSMLTASTDMFVEAAFASPDLMVSIPGLSASRTLFIMAQCLTALWGAYCVTAIHQLRCWKSLLCLAIPAAVFFLSRFMLKMG